MLDLEVSDMSQGSSSITKIQSSFTAGELDPKLRARSDIAVYYSGASKLRNVVAIPQGGVTRRPGLQYIDYEVPPGAIRLIPFVFSDDYHYLLVLSTGLLQVLRNEVLVAEVEHSMTNKQVTECTWAQLNDVLLIFHSDFSPLAFLRYSDTQWETEPWNIQNPPTYPDTLTPTTTTLTISTVSGATIDFSTWTFGNTQITTAETVHDAFTDEDAGKYIRGALGGLFHITSIATTKKVNGIVLSPFTNELSSGKSETPPGDWWFESLCFSEERGYPCCGCFYQGRLFMAGTRYQPTGIWASVINNEHNFQNWIPSYDDNGLFLVARGTQTPIHHIFASSALIFFSTESVFYLNTGLDNGPITPTTVSILKAEGSSGADVNQEPFSVAGSFMYLRSGGKAVVEGTYLQAAESYVFRNLNLLSSHLLNSPKDIAYRRQKSTTEADYILAVNGDGTLSVLCTLREQEINAWTVCHTEGKFLQVGIDGSEMYFIVQRYINGILYRFLEKFNSDIQLDSSVDNPGEFVTYDGVQCTYDIYNLTYQFLNFTSVRGVGHLKGETVSVILDGTMQPQQVVTSDRLTLAREGNDVQVGLQFPVVDDTTGSRVFVESMPLEVELPTGSSADKKKRLVEVTAVIDNTSQLTICKNSVPMRRLNIDTLDTPIPIVSGNITVKGILGWEENITVSIGQTLPLPFTLIGMVYRIKV